MRRTLVVLVVICAGLFAWERSLVTAARTEREERGRVGRVLSSEKRDAMQIAAVRVETASGASYLHGRVEGVWRSLDFHRAPVSGGALSALVDQLSNAEGLVVADEGAQATDYGIGAGDGLRISFCGPRVLQDPGGDVLVAFDLGKSIPGREGSFLRLHGEREVWAVDVDPRSVVERGWTDELAPLLDPALVPATWPGWSGDLERVSLDRGDGSSLELERRAVEVTPEELQRGVPPWSWFIRTESGEVRAQYQQSFAYRLFLERAGFVGIATPERAGELGLDRPRAKLTLVPREGGTLELLVGPPLPDGRAAVLNPWARTVYLVTEEVAALLVPAERLFLEPSEENPWDPYLH